MGKSTTFMLASKEAKETPSFCLSNALSNKDLIFRKSFGGVGIVVCLSDLSEILAIGQVEFMFVCCLSDNVFLISSSLSGQSDNSDK